MRAMLSGGRRMMERALELILAGHDPRTALRIAACESRGLPICGSLDHNDGCTNLRCPVWGSE